MHVRRSPVARGRGPVPVTTSTISFSNQGAPPLQRSGGEAPYNIRPLTTPQPEPTVHPVSQDAAILGGSLLQSPIRPDRVLVITLDSDWAVDIARTFPGAEVITIPDMAQWRLVPQNMQAWNGSQILSFDLIHCKGLLGNIPSFDEMIEGCFRMLAPGGWLEMFETSDEYVGKFQPLRRDSAWYEASCVAQKLEKATGCPFSIDRRRWVPSLKKFGFDDVKQRETLVSGDEHLERAMNRVGGLLGRVGSSLGEDDLQNRLTSEASQVLMQSVQVWGQKPMTPTRLPADSDDDATAEQLAKLRFGQDIANHLQWEPSSLLDYRVVSRKDPNLAPYIERGDFQSKYKRAHPATRSRFDYYFQAFSQDKDSWSQLRGSSGLSWVLNDQEEPPPLDQNAVKIIAFVSHILRCAGGEESDLSFMALQLDETRQIRDFCLNLDRGAGFWPVHSGGLDPHV